MEQGFPKLCDIMDVLNSLYNNNNAHIDNTATARTGGQNVNTYKHGRVLRF